MSTPWKYLSSTKTDLTKCMEYYPNNSFHRMLELFRNRIDYKMFVFIVTLMNVANKTVCLMAGNDNLGYFQFKCTFLCDSKCFQTFPLNILLKKYILTFPGESACLKPFI